MTLVILNKRTKEERVRYENVVNFYVEPTLKVVTLGISFKGEDRIELINSDEYMVVE